MNRKNSIDKDLATLDELIEEVSALSLVPLKLQDMGTWNPEEEYWGEEDEPIEEWAKPIIARGERPAFEMEQVLPRADPGEMSDPIIDAVDLKNAGKSHEAVKLLMELCESDLRCLDAHAHLGHFIFDNHPQKAIRHYEVGLRIGELSLPAGSRARFRGATSTIVLFCGACTATGCLFGG